MWSIVISPCVVSFIRVRMALAIVRSNSLLLRTERDKGVCKRRAPMDSAACLPGRDMSRGINWRGSERGRGREGEGRDAGEWLAT